MQISWERIREQVIGRFNVFSEEKIENALGVKMKHSDYIKQFANDPDYLHGMIDVLQEENKKLIKQNLRLHRKLGNVKSLLEPFAKAGEYINEWNLPPEFLVSQVSYADCVRLARWLAANPKERE